MIMKILAIRANFFDPFSCCAVVNSLHLRLLHYKYFELLLRNYDPVQTRIAKVPELFYGHFPTVTPYTERSTAQSITATGTTKVDHSSVNLRHLKLLGHMTYTPH